MAQFEQLAEAALRRPGERLIHVTNHASAAALYAQATKDGSQSSLVILNAKALTEEISSRRYDRWILKPLARVGGAARAAARAPTVKIGDAEFGMANLAVVDKQSAVGSSSKEAIFVFENGIDSDGFGSLFSYYSTAEPTKMPTIVVAADRDMAQLEGKLSRYSNSFTFHEVYGSTATYWKQAPSSVSMSLGDIVEGLVGNNTLAVATTNFSLDGIDPTDFDEIAQNLSAAYAIIRSVTFEYNKFSSARLTMNAVKLLDRVDAARLSAGPAKGVLRHPRSVHALGPLLARG